MPPSACFYSPDNVVFNGGFESMLTGWSLNGTPTVIVNPHPFNDGTLVCRLAAGDSISQNIDMEYGRAYFVRAYVKFFSAAAVTDPDWSIRIKEQGTGNLLYTMDANNPPVTLPNTEAYFSDSDLGFTLATGNIVCSISPGYVFSAAAPPPVSYTVALEITGPSVDSFQIDVISITPFSVDGSTCDDAGSYNALTFTPTPIFTALEGGPNPAGIKVKVSGTPFYYDEELGVITPCPCWWIIGISNQRITSSMMLSSGDSNGCNEPGLNPVISYNTQGLKEGKYSGLIQFYGAYGDFYEMGAFVNVLGPGGGGGGGDPGGGGPPIDPPGTIDIPCLIVQSVSGSIVAQYYVRLLDQSGTVVAIFDDWRSLEFTNLVNDVGNYSFTIYGDDDRIDLFEVDGIVEVWRSVPGLGVDWYREFIGFHRGEKRDTDENGDKIYTSYGVSLNDLLARTVIAYKAGTVNADKDDYADDVMKEYVEENCGPSATATNGRMADGAFPGFTTEVQFSVGEVWTGSRAFENLLDVLKEIAQFTNFDFAVLNPLPAQFKFETYPTQLGRDRTDETLDATTGLNAYGAIPVIFSLDRGNVQDMSYGLDRTSEINTIFVLGKGEGATREVVVKAATTTTDSPWNRREIGRAGGGQDYTYQLEDLGEEELNKGKAKERFDFAPLQTPISAYGKHYFLGDRVQAVYDGIKRAKRIVGVSISVSNDGEEVSITFADKSDR